MQLVDILIWNFTNVKFTPPTKGIYTMHTHVIPAGKSMMSMMNNHMDIGIIVKYWKLH